MTRDYKHRAQPGGGRKQQNKKSSVAFWKWLLAAVLVVAFILFLVKLRSSAPTHIAQPGQVVQLPVTKESSKKNPVVKDPPQEKQTAAPEGPQFEFYTILPDQDEIIPDYEIKKLKRAETVGKPEPSSYILQAGSFREFAQADKVKARLALLGIQARIEVATVGKATWNRVKLGPYPNMRSADHVRSKLRKAGVDAVVLHDQP